MEFEFSTTKHIIFGNGAIQKLADYTSVFGKKAFVIHGKNQTRYKPILNQLNNAGIETIIFSIPGEPTTTLITEGVRMACSNSCDVVIGIGGGSVIDAGKAISALITNDGNLTDYLEVIGKGKSIDQQPAPYIAIPTTAGTGAEATCNAVLLSPEHKVKVSMRSKLMYPRVAIVDPELTYSMPPTITASTGLDALTQLIEAYVSNKANPLTDGICLEGLKRAGRALYLSYKTGDKSAREDMCIASLFSGMALANSRLGAVHGLAAPLGGKLSAPHGMICARLLPFVMEMNIRLLLEKNPTSNFLKRFETIAIALTGNNNAVAMDSAIWVKKICMEMKIPALREFGLRNHDITEIAQMAMKTSSIKGNPVELGIEELIQILQLAI